MITWTFKTLIKTLKAFRIILFSSILAAIILIIITNLWVRGWLFQGNHPYGFHQVLSQNHFLAIDYDSVKVRWDFLTPHVAIDNFQLNNELINLSSKRSIIRVNLWESLKKFTPIIQELQLTSNHLDITLTRSNHSALDVEQLRSIFDGAQFWTLDNSTIHLQSEQQTKTFTLNQIRVENSDNFRRLLFKSPSLTSVIELQGNTLKQMHGEIYIKANQDLLNIISLYAGHPQLSFTNSDIEVWLTLQPNLRLDGDIHLNINGDLTNTSNQTINASLSTTALVQTNNQFSNLTVNTSPIQMSINQVALPAHALNWVKIDNLSEITSPETLDLTAWNNTVIGILNNESIHKTYDKHGILSRNFQKLQLAGFVEALTLRLQSGENKVKIQELSGRLINASNKQLNKIPLFTGINGQFKTDTKHGFLYLKTKAMNIHLPNRFQAPITLENVDTRLYWNIASADNKMLFNADTILFTYQQQPGNAKMAMSIPINSPTKFPTTKPYQDINLAIGLTQIHVEDIPSLLPITSSKTLKTYIQNALVIDANNQTFLSDVGFIYRERLEETLWSNYQIAAEFDSLDLQFLPNWPVAESLKGQLFVNNGEVNASLSQANLLNTQLSSVKATVAKNTNLDFSFTSNVKGTGNDMLDLLRKTPVRDSIGSSLDNIQLSDITNTHLTLTTSLNNQSESAVIPDIDAKVQFNNNNLLLSDANIELNELNGELHYQLINGQNHFMSDTITAVIWQQPLTAQISSGGERNENLNIKLDTLFQATTIYDLFGIDLNEFIQGTSAIQGKITLPIDSSSRPQVYHFTSNAKGYTVELPLAFGKASGDQGLIEASLYNFPKKQHLGIHYHSPNNTQISSLLDYDIDSDGKLQLKAFAVDINQQAKTESFLPIVTPGYFTLNAQLENSSISILLDLIDRFAETNNDNSNQPHLIAGLPTLINLHTDALNIGDNFKLEDISSQIESNTSSWVINFQQPIATGSIEIFHNNQTPKLALQKLHLDTFFSENTSPQSKTDDALKAAIPQELPQAEVNIEQLIYQNRSLGSLSFNIEPDINGVLINNIQSNILDNENQNNNYINWTYHNKAHHTSALFDFATPQGTALLNFGFDQEIITARKTDIVADIKWSGSPAAIALNNIEGDIAFQLEKGVFKEVPTSTNLTARLISLINLDNWSRRLLLDFSDVVNEGTAYDKIEGQFQLNQGEVIIINDIKAKLPASKLELRGNANLVDDSIDAEMTLKLPIIQNTAWLAGFLINLPAAAGLYVISKLFSDRIENLTDVTYQIDGKLSDPNAKLKRLKKGDDITEPE